MFFFKYLKTFLQFFYANQSQNLATWPIPRYHGNGAGLSWVLVTAIPRIEEWRPRKAHPETSGQNTNESGGRAHHRSRCPLPLPQGLHVPARVCATVSECGGAYTGGGDKFCDPNDIKLCDIMRCLAKNMRWPFVFRPRRIKSGPTPQNNNNNNTPSCDLQWTNGSHNQTRNNNDMWFAILFADGFRWIIMKSNWIIWHRTRTKRKLGTPQITEIRKRLKTPAKPQRG